MTREGICALNTLCYIVYLHVFHSRPVYEYPLNGQWIMMDVDDGYILWTGIWKGDVVVSFHTVLMTEILCPQLWGIPKVSIGQCCEFVFFYDEISPSS